MLLVDVVVVVVVVGTLNHSTRCLPEHLSTT